MDALLARLRVEDPDEIWAPHRRLRRIAARATASGEGPHAELARALGDVLPAATELALARASRSARGRERRELTRLAWRIACTLEQLLPSADGATIARDSLALHYARVDLAALARAASAAFARAASEQGIALHVDAPPVLMAELDVGAVETVLATLLFGAFKHTPARGRIECSLREDAQLDSIVVRVADSGPPVRGEEVEALFDGARRLDRSVPCDLGAVRLGLGTARTLVELHGGTLAVEESGPRESGHRAVHAAGAVFRACLPRRAPRGACVRRGASSLGQLAAQVAEAAARELVMERGLEHRCAARGARPLVLVVEDSAALQRMIVQELEPEHATASAFDARTGLERAAELRPDLIITDLGLPGEMNGAALIAALRADATLAHVPVLVVTGASDPRSLVGVLESGARDLLRKPFLIAELRARVRTLIEAKQARDVLASTIGRQATGLVEMATEIGARQRELAQALSDLEQARVFAERASQTKTNFLRMMSHELRTPLAALTLQQRILERDLDPPAPRVRRGLEAMARSGRRMLHLVDTVLEWAQIDSGGRQLEITRFDPCAIAAEVVRDLSDLAEKKGLALELDASPGVPPIASDRRLVGLLVGGLVGRAVRITEAGRVEIAVRARGARTVLAVRDAGASMREERFQHLLDPLASTGDLIREEGSGSGLELHVLRDFAHALDGSLRLEPDAREGNCVIAELPSLSRERTTARMKRSARGA